MEVASELAGKVALITGASRGIGESIAIRLASLGVHCVLTSRKAEGVELAAARLTAQGYEAEAIQSHGGRMEDVRSLIEQIEKRCGRLDILVNNAATNPYAGPMAGASEAVWDKTFDVNLKGVFFLIQRAVPLMQRAGGGVIVNIASIEGVRPDADRAIYAMTKAAILSMTRSWARELAVSNIRVNAILPGLVETQMSKVLLDDDEAYREIIRTVPMGRHAVPDEVASVVQFLVKSASSYMTGSALTVDGGALA